MRAGISVTDRITPVLREAIARVPPGHTPHGGRHSRCGPGIKPPAITAVMMAERPHVRACFDNEVE